MAVPSCKLPSKALLLWRLRLVAAIVAPAVLGGFFYYTIPNVFTIFTFVWFSLFLILCFLYFPFYYKGLSYAITESMVKVNRGVFYFRMDAVYIKNIQYTAITQTILQKVLGLATLRIYAAGGKVFIPSMDYSQARQLRIQLIKKMEAISK